MASTASIDDALVSSSDRYLTVIARISRADPATLAETAQDQRIEALKQHATRTQAPVREFAGRRDGVAVVNSFWVANAVALEVDTERVSLDDLAELPGVERLHDNFELEAHRGETETDTAGTE